MARNLPLALALSALLTAPFAVPAAAGIGDSVGGPLAAWRTAAPVEKAQYFLFDDQNYCWYDDGWNGPGWYVCESEWYQGYGWGGPYGWNGWGGGHRIWSHGPRVWPPGGHGHGVWPPGGNGLGVWHPGSPPHGFGGGPAFHGFGGGPGFGGFGGGRTFQGFGGHGGHGH